MTLFDLFCSINYGMLLNFILCAVADIVLLVSLRIVIKEHLGAFYNITCIVWIVITTVLLILTGICIFQPHEVMHTMYEVK